MNACQHKSLYAHICIPLTHPTAQGMHVHAFKRPNAHGVSRETVRTANLQTGSPLEPSGLKAAEELLSLLAVASFCVLDAHLVQPIPVILDDSTAPGNRAQGHPQIALSGMAGSRRRQRPVLLELRTNGCASMHASCLVLGKLGSSQGGATSDARIGTSISACDADSVAVNVDSMSSLCLVSWALRPSSSSRTLWSDLPRDASAAMLPRDSAWMPY